MLPARYRLGGRRDFDQVVRRGARARRGSLVVHLSAPSDVESPGGRAPVAKAGFVVSRAVGGSVVRHAVVRRLRAVTLAQLPGLPPGSRLVVRAMPEAASASSARLSADLGAAIAAVRDRWPA